MNDRTNHVRNGIGAVRPFIYGRLDLLDFVKNVFGGVELERNSVAGGFHVQTLIGDSVLVLAAMAPYAHATRASSYVYVVDVDASTSGPSLQVQAPSASPPTAPSRSGLPA